MIVQCRIKSIGMQICHSKPFRILETFSLRASYFTIFNEITEDFVME